MEGLSTNAPRIEPAAGRAAVLPGLLAEIRARRREFSARLSIPEDIIEKLKEVGVYRAIVAKRLVIAHLGNAAA